MVQNSPDIDLDKPVSRQAQSRLNEYYGWADFGPRHGSYAPAPGLPGVILAQPTSTTQVLEQEEEQIAEERGDPHLRSIQEIIGYHIEATDGGIGHVDDFFVSENDWTIRYMLVDTRTWLPGRKVLVAPDWITQVNWRDSKIRVDVPRQRIEDSPEYDPRGSLERGYESKLYDYYGYPGYWI